MCGVYGVFNQSSKVSEREIISLAKTAEVRGVDSSGLILELDNQLHISKRDFGSSRLIKEQLKNVKRSRLAAGHSRLVTNDVSANQPVVHNEYILFHNGIIANYKEVASDHSLKTATELDSEVIPLLFEKFKEEGFCEDDIVQKIFRACEGVISAILLDIKENKIHLISNNGSLYYFEQSNSIYVASEYYALKKLGFDSARQIIGLVTHDYEFGGPDVLVDNKIEKVRNYLLPKFVYSSSKDNLLERSSFKLDRCSKCILPSTMPFIMFNSEGVCNYCENYTLKNIPKPISILHSLVEPYRREGERDCIVPFSGGRDSSYALHLIVNELGMNPIAYTYDWGMVTDLGRRNISRMCSKLGVENIIVAADITKKRENIRKNVLAWLKNPHLGMISLWTAGDKHFFRFCEEVKTQTGISLNLWGVNPMETTHFKTGFLGIPPEFHNLSVYSNGVRSQLDYQLKRYKEYFKNPAYFNSSIWDTLSGEYWRSLHQKSDYFHIFDYWTWDEKIVDSTLRGYNWEWANDTPTSWRIGDGTAALYNYVYYTVAGFTEHDTFRSNQIREGMISREEALSLVAVENLPRYESIQWYLDSIGLEFEPVIKAINNIPKLYTPAKI